MKEFNIDLVIDKTFNVFAETVEEAKEKAIQKIKQLVGTYNSLIIDEVEEIGQVETWDTADFEDLNGEFENEYEAYCYDENGACVHCYVIEADHWAGAKDAAIDFYKDDFPDRPLLRVALVCGREEYNYYEI